MKRTIHYLQKKDSHRIIPDRRYTNTDGTIRRLQPKVRMSKKERRRARAAPASSGESRSPRLVSHGGDQALGLRGGQ